MLRPSESIVDQSNCRYLVDHNAAVLTVALSKDGRVCLSGAADHTIRVWSLNEPFAPNILYGHSGMINRVLIAPDNHTALSTSFDGTLRIWDLVSLTQLKCIAIKNSREIYDLAISDNGKYAAICFFKGVHIIDLSTLSICSTLDTDSFHNAPIDRLALSQNGKLIACATGEISEENKIGIWKTHSSTFLTWLVGHKDAITTVVFLNKTTLVSGDMSGEVIIWDLVSEEKIMVIEIGGWIHQINTSDDRKSLFIATNEEVVLLDTFTGTILGRSKLHKNDITAIAISKSPEVVATSSFDQSICICSRERILQEIPDNNSEIDQIFRLKTSTDGKALVAMCDSKIIFYDINTLAITNKIEDCLKDGKSDFALSGDGRFIAYETKNRNQIIVKDTSTFQIYAKLPNFKKEIAQKMALSQKGEVLILGGLTKIVACNVSNGIILWSHHIDDGTVITAVTVSKDGHYYAWATAGIECKIQVVEMKSSSKIDLSELIVNKLVVGLEFTENQRCLIGQCSDIRFPKLMIWNIATKEVIYEKAGIWDLRCFHGNDYREQYQAAYISPDVNIIDTRNNRIIAALPGQLDSIVCGHNWKTWFGLDGEFLQGFILETEDNL